MNTSEIKTALDYIINKGGSEKELINNNLTIYLRSDYRGLDCYNIMCDLYINDTNIIKDMMLFISIKEGEGLNIYSERLPLLINEYIVQKISELNQAMIIINN
jgi:hypothetical protein